MKRYVNGELIELADEGTVLNLGDRLAIDTPEGLRTAVAIKNGDETLVSYRGRQYVVQKKVSRARAAGAAGSGSLKAPMPGAIIDVLVTEGDSVEKGTKCVVLEAMKTHQTFSAPFDGTVSKVGVSKGQQVSEGDLMVEITPTPT